MTRLYNHPTKDAADVRRRDDVPVQFWWHERRYLVRAVLQHWLESGGWWARDHAASGEGGAVDDKEREIWRVEAMFGPLAQAGVFDLCFDWSQASWTVIRVQD